MRSAHALRHFYHIFFWRMDIGYGVENQANTILFSFDYRSAVEFTEAVIDEEQTNRHHIITESERDEYVRCMHRQT